MKGWGRTITVRERENTIVMTGWKVAEIARHAGLRPIYSGASQGWVTDARKLPDLLAFCQLRHIAIEVTSVQRDLAGVQNWTGEEGSSPESSDSPASEIPQGEAVPEHGEPDLFGGAA